jgi:monoterpene epsilon-lactone hydrolase
MASPEFHKFLDLVERNRPSGDEVDVEAMRRDMDKVGGRFPNGVTGIADELGGVPGEWVMAPGADDGAALLYLHGGGYVAGSVSSHRNLVGHLAVALGCRIFAANYTLAPENPHPGPVEDATVAYRALIDQGYPASRLAIAGDSAGGGLTMAALLALKQGKDPLPAAAVCISPWVDIEATGESMTSRAAQDPMVSPGRVKAMAELFLGPAGDPRDPLASPLHGDLGGLPPILIQVGDAEILLDDSTRLAARITEAGGEAELEVWPEMIHVWHGSASYVPESDQAIERIATWLRPHLGLC